MSKFDEYMAQKKNEQQNQNTLNEDTLNEGFREMSESDDPMERWWDGLQETLDKAGCDLDLSLPEDLCRLEILDIERVARDEYNIRSHYATDPERRPIDLEDLSSESIVSRQRVGMPDRSTLEHIYTAAQEGRLFVRSQREHNPRQITADAQGKSGVGNDIFKMTKDESDCGYVWEEPKKPKKPSFWTRVKAFFGNADAKKDVKRFDDNVETYQKNMQYWNRAKELEAKDPQMVENSRKLVICNQWYFGKFENAEELREYGIKMQDIHREGAIRSLPPEERGAARDLDDLEDSICEYAGQVRSRRNKVVDEQKKTTGKTTKELEREFEEKPLDEETKEALAGVFFCRAQQKLATLALDGRDGKRYVRLTGDKLKEAVKNYQNSPEFQRAVEGRKGSMLHKLYTCETEELDTVVDRVTTDAFTRQQPEQKNIGKETDAPTKKVEKKLGETERKSEVSMGGPGGN